MSKKEERVAGVFTLGEAKKKVREEGLTLATQKIKWVTTGTFEPVEAATLRFQLGGDCPKIHFKKILLNGISAYPSGEEGGGLLSAAVLREEEGEKYTGANIMEELIQDRKIRFQGQGQVSDFYAKRDLDCLIERSTLKKATLELYLERELTPWGVINSSEKTVSSSMGILLPECGNMNHSGCAEISPFIHKNRVGGLKVGTPVFLGGTMGSVAENGENSLVLRGSLKGMDRRYVRAGGFGKTGSALFIGIGIAFSIEQESDLEALMDGESLEVEIYDIGSGHSTAQPCAKYPAGELLCGSVQYQGKSVKTASPSSRWMAEEIANELKNRLEKGEVPICQKQE